MGQGVGRGVGSVGWLALVAATLGAGACSKHNDTADGGTAVGAGGATSVAGASMTTGAAGGVVSNAGNVSRPSTAGAAASGVGASGGAARNAGAGTSGILPSAHGGAGGNAGTAASAGTTGGAGANANAGAGGSPGMQPYKGVANSPCAARTMLKVSWYYNWEQTETEACKDGRGGEFVPMIWGHTGAEQTASSIQTSIQSFVSKGYGYVLGFNEPDNSSQSNIAVSKAVELWPAFDNPAILVGSPGTAANQNPGQAWFKDFMTQLNADASLRADFLAIHWYGWNSGSCDAKASQLESYVKWAEGFAGNRPIWITEWGCLNQSAPDAATVVTFYKAAIAMFAKHPRIERYSWYPWATNCDLNNKDGSLTELGKVYADAPAYK